MAKYIFDKERGMMVDKATGEPMVSDEDRKKPLQTPQTFSDLPGYQSPVDGSWIEGRRARKYDMESNGCVDANDLTGSAPRKLKNTRFAKKHGLTHLLDEQVRD